MGILDAWGGGSGILESFKKKNGPFFLLIYCFLIHKKERHYFILIFISYNIFELILRLFFLKLIFQYSLFSTIIIKK